MSARHSVFSRLFGSRGGYRGAVQEDGGGRPVHISRISNTKDLSDWLNGGGRRVDPMSVATVYACVRLLSDSIAGLPLRLYERKGLSDVLAEKHRVDELLHIEPNPWQTPYEFWRMIAGHVLMYGNAYAYIDRKPNKEIRWLVPLHPTRMKPEQRDGLRVSYTYTRAGGSVQQFKQEEILHVRGLCEDGLVGLGVIEAARNALELSVRTEEYGSKLFTNGVRPSGVLKTEQQLSDEAVNRLKQSFEASNAGPENAHRMMVLEQGLSWQQIGLNAEDAQFLETRKFQRNELCMFFGVPPHMIGDIERGTSWGTGLEQQNLGFLTYSLKPWLVNLQQAIRRDLLLPAERTKYLAKHDTADLTRADFTARQSGLQTMRSNGVLSVNEWRRIEGLNPVSGGDDFNASKGQSTDAPPQQQDRPPDPKPPGARKRKKAAA